MRVWHLAGLKIQTETEIIYPLRNRWLSLLFKKCIQRIPKNLLKILILLRCNHTQLPMHLWRKISRYILLTTPRRSNVLIHRHCHNRILLLRLVILHYLCHIHFLISHNIPLLSQCGRVRLPVRTLYHLPNLHPHFACYILIQRPDFLRCFAMRFKLLRRLPSIITVHKRNPMSDLTRCTSHIIDTDPSRARTGTLLNTILADTFAN